MNVYQWWRLWVGRHQVQGWRYAELRARLERCPACRRVWRER